jgi:lipase maturation factor 1
MAKPVLIYDGDCQFCCRWIERWRGLTGDRVDYRASQDCAAEYPKISEGEFATAVQWVGSDGRRESGAAAVLSALATAHFAGRALLALYRNVPLFAWVADAGYRVVAENRQFFSKVTRRPWVVGFGLGLLVLLVFAVFRNRRKN